MTIVVNTIQNQACMRKIQNVLKQKLLLNQYGEKWALPLNGVESGEKILDLVNDCRQNAGFVPSQQEKAANWCNNQ